MIRLAKLNGNVAIDFAGLRAMGASFAVSATEKSGGNNTNGL